MLETSHPPGIYIPRADVAMDYLREVPGRQTMCEFKGYAAYLDVVVGEHIAAGAAWTYREPVSAYAALQDHISLYPGRMDACWLDDERVQGQEGSFYGGWITADITGPFKGGAGTRGW